MNKMFALLAAVLGVAFAARLSRLLPLPPTARLP